MVVSRHKRCPRALIKIVGHGCLLQATVTMHHGPSSHRGHSFRRASSLGCRNHHALQLVFVSGSELVKCPYGDPHCVACCGMAQESAKERSGALTRSKVDVNGIDELIVIRRGGLAHVAKQANVLLSSKAVKDRFLCLQLGHACTFSEARSINVE